MDRTGLGLEVILFSIFHILPTCLEVILFSIFHISPTCLGCWLCLRCFQQVTTPGLQASVSGLSGADAGAAVDDKGTAPTGDDRATPIAEKLAAAEAPPPITSPPPSGDLSVTSPPGVASPSSVTASSQLSSVTGGAFFPAGVLHAHEALATGTSTPLREDSVDESETDEPMRRSRVSMSGGSSTQSTLARAGSFGAAPDGDGQDSNDCRQLDRALNFEIKGGTEEPIARD